MMTFVVGSGERSSGALKGQGGGAERGARAGRDGGTQCELYKTQPRRGRGAEKVRSMGGRGGTNRLAARFLSASGQCSAGIYWHSFSGRALRDEAKGGMVAFLWRRDERRNNRLPSILVVAKWW